MVEQPPVHSVNRLSRLAVAAVLAAVCVAVAVRVLTVPPFIVDSDEGEYFSIARHVARGDGFILSIKWHFFDNQPARHSAVGERPLLFPLLLALAMKVSPTLLACKVLTIALGLVLCVLFFYLARHMMPVPWAALAATFVLLNPVVISSSQMLLADVPYNCLLLTVLLLITRASSRLAYLLIGALVGLLHLTRPEGALVLVAVAAWLGVRREYRLLLPAVAGFVMAAAPYLVLNWATNGSPTYSTLAFNFRVKSFPQEGMTDPFRPAAPGAVEFLSSNYRWAAVEVLYRGMKQLDDLTSRRFLCLLAAFAFVGSWQAKPGPRQKHYMLLLWLIALSQFAIPALAWGSAYRYSYLLSPFLFLVMLSCRGLWVLSTTAVVPRWSVILPPVIVLTLYGLMCVNSIVSPPGGGLRTIHDREFVSHADFLRLRSEPAATVATHDPWSLNVLADRPCLLLPTGVSESQALLDQYVSLYQPEYILVRRRESIVAPPGYTDLCREPDSTWVLFGKQ
jgi:4-amino-4-deoxy-L-arabinose transferase-like glycosyltransferase